MPSPAAALAAPSAPSPSGASSSSSAAPSGDVLLFSTRALTVANAIQAHKAPLAFLALNAAGTLLATASAKGTVVRVWGVPGAEKLYEFRRGTRETRIYSMNFNVVGSLLAVSSAHDTVHVFKLGGATGGEGGGGADGPGSPSDSQDGASADSVGGYEAFVAKQAAPSVSYVVSPPPFSL